MDQELDICNRVYEIATHNMRRVCVTIKKNNVSKPPYIQIRLFTAKENEDLKQVAYVNYTLNEFKELSIHWETLCLLIIVNLSKAL